MRSIGWLLFLLTLGGWIASEVPSSVEPRRAQAGKQSVERVEWRRTEQGWEPIEAWKPPVEFYQPNLHPGLVAMLVLLASMLALIGLPQRPQSVGSEAATGSPTER
ncbi:MAG: hypothetical protein K1X74_00895 [Pirellulales bacterium]|nr:hypothetical protein [Pirellulales bacterium]